jgi:hypothetical protein
MNRRSAPILICALVFFFSTIVAYAQHLADPEFNTKVERPAYSKTAPRVMFDEAHNNFHTTSGRYKPFADLLANDGYHLVVNHQPFTKKSLESFKVLVIVNALAEDIDEEGADQPAFTDEESNAVRDWVRGGGALLLIADPKPFGAAATMLAKQFGVEMTGHFAQDDANSAEKFHSSRIVYSEENHLLQDHPILQGRDNSEKIKRVIVFSGQSLKGPQESVAFLKLSDSATDSLTADFSNTSDRVSANGLAQGIALRFGGGRVVVLAEADMLSALLGNPPEKEPIGMNYPGVDNKQLTLNIMHWLSGVLK